MLEQKIGVAVSFQTAYSGYPAVPPIACRSAAGIDLTESFFRIPVEFEIQEWCLTCGKMHTYAYDPSQLTGELVAMPAYASS